MDATCRLPAELTIYTVGEFRPQCLDWLARADAATAAPQQQGLSVDAGALAEVDAAGLQLLLSLKNALAARGWPLALRNAGPVLRQACAALGVPSLQETSDDQ